MSHLCHNSCHSFFLVDCQYNVEPYHIRTSFWLHSHLHSHFSHTHILILDSGLAIVTAYEENKWLTISNKYVLIFRYNSATLSKYNMWEINKQKEPDKASKLVKLYNDWEHVSIKFWALNITHSESQWKSLKSDCCRCFWFDIALFQTQTQGGCGWKLMIFWWKEPVKAAPNFTAIY